ncbi:hypothetical protein Pmar_PMAR024407 [Perkinsus marinus ATCC 50983]|uniref:Uncharacterized protein n=1 Tax=Perkinsus marinus (strain ATCC 50983 / TXsc) TaxID=423536 RepID=C5KM05_PERM5|nr:hypothetical protein Pmar_PMAR024407 [Perkinsus marinus ATCC 50983]EER14520.1 hypothetical protein Pmar_PMAR024407 [Perkinsus marinus ATCC 50983]|eukprot:XP_002782725.1 hypothetical protein Pmar_PMAR024407 [Perkinsus marinus ATCC 50983]
MTTSLLLILLATSPFATSSECNAHFDGDGIEWDGPEVCAASQSRFLQTTDFIKAVPATIQVEMLYNATGSDTTEIDLLLTNTGSGVEVVEFIDLGRDLNVMELQQSTSAVPEVCWLSHYGIAELSHFVRAKTEMAQVPDASF